MTTEVSIKPLQPVHLLISVVLFCVLFAISYPYYRYFVDPDAVAYLTMAERAAAGEPMRLVNALWSPLHPAFVALCMKAGVPSLLAAQLTNGLACLLIIVVTYSLFRRFRVERFLGICALSAVSAFLTYALYKQLFCDLWQVGLLLVYLLLATSGNFLTRPVLWFLCAVVMALAAYAKVYSFYFLLLHFPAMLWLWRRKSGGTFPWKPYLLVMTFQLLLLAPWTFLMHKKYGVWAFSKSGALNTSWTLVGHKSLRPDIAALIPPPYPNSPYTWEDPYLSEGALHARFESLALMKSQAGHAGQAALQGVAAGNQISSLLLPIIAASLLLVFFKRRSTIFTVADKILLAAASILPLGYLLLHFEARYIWLLVPLGMLLGAAWLQMFRQKLSNERGYRIACVLFALSFIAYPAYDMKTLYRKGESVYNLAGSLAKMGIRGSFASNDNPGRAGCLAYWLACNYYAPAGEVINPEALLADMRRYKVAFYFHHQNGIDGAGAFMLDEQGQPFKRVDGGKINGMQVFLITP